MYTNCTLTVRYTLRARTEYGGGRGGVCWAQDVHLTSQSKVGGWGGEGGVLVCWGEGRGDYSFVGGELVLA